MNFDRVFWRHLEMNHEPELSSEFEGTLSAYTKEGRNISFGSPGVWLHCHNAVSSTTEISW